MTPAAYTTLEKIRAVAHLVCLALICFMLVGYSVYDHHAWYTTAMLIFMALAYLLGAYFQWQDLSRGEDDK